MNRRDIVIGLVILAILAGIVYWRQARTKKQVTPVAPQTLSVEQKIEDKFNVQIPEGVDKAELKDVTGGTASGIVTRKYENGRFTLDILADLPDAEAGKFYQGWMVKGKEGETGYSIVKLGRMQIAKGGWSLEFRSSTNFSDHNQIIVSSEEKVGISPAKSVIEGSF